MRRPSRRARRPQHRPRPEPACLAERRRGITAADSRVDRGMPRPLPVLIFAAALAARPGRRTPETSAPVPSASAAPSKATFAMEAEPVAEVGNLCLFRPRKDPIMSGFADGTGAAWEGELRVRDLASLDTKWISQQDK